MCIRELHKTYMLKFGILYTIFRLISPYNNRIEGRNQKSCLDSTRVSLQKVDNLAWTKAFKTEHMMLS